MRTLVGKIGRLPPATRDQVCQRLHANRTAADILAWLNALPPVRLIMDQLFDGTEITPQNLSEFKHGPGFSDWIIRQDQLQDTRNLSHFMMELARASDGNLTEGAVAVTAGRLLAQIETTEGDELNKVAKAIAALRKTDIDSLRARQHEVELQQKDRQLNLEEDRFRRQTVELFLDWFDDRQAKDIAQSAEPKEIKMDRLISRIWGDRPENIGGES